MNISTMSLTEALSTVNKIDNDAVYDKHELGQDFPNKEKTLSISKGQSTETDVKDDLTMKSDKPSLNEVKTGNTMYQALLDFVGQQKPGDTVGSPTDEGLTKKRVFKPLQHVADDYRDDGEIKEVFKKAPISAEDQEIEESYGPSADDTYIQACKNRCAHYRQLAGLSDDDILDKDNLDDDAIKKVCVLDSCSSADVREALLTECDALTEAVKAKPVTINQAAVNDIAQQAQEKTEDTVEKLLDRCLYTAKFQEKIGGDDWADLLLIGGTGTAKTSMVKEWSEAHNINLLSVSLSSADVASVGGAIAPDKPTGTIVTNLASTAYDSLDTPNSVLFLDEINRAKGSIRGTILKLIAEHTIPDGRNKSGVRKLKGFLFTVAAMNPPTDNYGADALHSEELNRFLPFWVKYNPAQLLKYLTGVFDKQEAWIKANSNDEFSSQYAKEVAGRRAITTALLSSKSFVFDSATEIMKDAAEEATQLDNMLTYRSFTNCIAYSNGTKEDVLHWWPGFCGKRHFNMVKDILENYQDVQDKSNDVLKTPTKSQVFKKAKGLNFDDLKDFIDNMKVDD